MRSAGKLLTVVLVAALALSSLAFVACGDIVLSSITAECSVTEYYAGDDFDESSVTVTAHYSDGSSRTVAGWTVGSGEDLAAGTASVRVSYTEGGVTATADVAITVTERPHAHDFTGGWKSDASGHWLECACGEKSEEDSHEWSAKTEVTEDVSCTEDGKQIVTCSVCGYSEEQTIAALDHDFTEPYYDAAHHWYGCSRCDATSERVAHDLALTVTGMRTEYFEGEKVTVEGASASVSCACGYKSAVDVSELTVPDEELTLDDDGTTVTVSYGELTFDVTVTVSPRVLDSVAIKPGYKTDYAIGEQFAGETLIVTYSDGSFVEAALTAEMLDGFDTSAPGSRTVTATYEDKTTQFVIYVGRDPESGIYRLGSETDVPYKVQAEDDAYVDMSEAVLQKGQTNKFENVAKTSNDSTAEYYPNGAEGYSTCNISVAGNKVTLRFVSDYAGKFTLGLRGQSGSGSGLNDQQLSEAFSVSVNGEPATIDGLLKAGSATGNNWCDMTVWTILDDVLGTQTMKAGVNEIEFAFLGKTTETMRFPNLDYFTVTFTEIYNDLSLVVSGSAEVPLGGSYTGGLTVTVMNGEDAIEENVPVTAEMISAFDSSAPGVKDITVSYFGLTANHTITVLPDKVATGIRVKDGYKQDYAIGEEFAGATLVTVYSDDSESESELTKEMLDGFDTSVPGEVTVGVTSGGMQTQFVIYVGRDPESGIYRLGSETNAAYKVQVENDSYVDMSEAETQDEGQSKFENTTKNAAGEVSSNGAEGYSTSNLSVNGNKITLRFFSDYAGKFTLGLRGQSGSFKGVRDQALDGAFTVTVNGRPATITGTLNAGSSTGTDWCDLTVWTELENILGEQYAAAGVNEITFLYTGSAGDVRFPNLDYFTVTFTEFYEDASLVVSGSAEAPMGGSYTDGLTVTLKNGEDVIEAVPVTAEMISGLDTSSAGEKTATVTYLGLTAECKVTVVDRDYELTIVGGTAGGENTVSLGYGDAIPEIVWENEENIVGYVFGGEAYASADGLTMIAGDATLCAVYADECTVVKPTDSVRWNMGMSDDSGKTTGTAGDTTAAVTGDTVIKADDAKRYSSFGAVASGARGLTFRGDVNFGSGDVAVFVVIVNHSENTLEDVYFGTECGAVSLGSVAADSEARGAAVIASDGNNHWPHLFFGDAAGLDFTIAVYTLAI